MVQTFKFQQNLAIVACSETLTKVFGKLVGTINRDVSPNQLLEMGYMTDLCVAHSYGVINDH